MLHWLGGRIHRSARWVVAVWLVLVVLAFGAASGALGFEGLFSRLKAGDAPTVPGESRDGLDLLQAAAPEGRAILLLVEGIDPGAASVKKLLIDQATALAAVPGVAVVADPLRPAVARSPFVATHGTAFIVSVTLRSDLAGRPLGTATTAVEDRLTAMAQALRRDTAAHTGAVRTTVGGVRQLVDEINGHVKNDLRIGEAIALPLSLLVMVLVFGGLLAAGLPVLGAIASIGGALAALLGFSLAMDLESSVPSVVSVLGLGLCIDYGLLLVSRFREEVAGLRRDAGDPTEATPPAAPAASDRTNPWDGLLLDEALRRTLATAGRTVLFSGVTVAISLLGLMFFHNSLLRAVGAAGVSVVLVAVLVALTLVPALIALSGERIVRPGITHRVPLLNRLARRLGDVAPEHGVFSRLAARVQRRPVITFVVCLGLLVVLGLPALRIQLVTTGTSVLPTSSAQRHLFDTMDADFPGLTVAPIRVVSHADATRLGAYAAQLTTLDGVASVDAVQTNGVGAQRISYFGVRVKGDAEGAAARDVVDRIREHRPDFQIWVTGDAALVRDFLGDVAAQAPPAVGMVALATIVLLFLMTGSLLIPLKALLMNVVSLSATFGVLVLVFQDGYLSSLLDFTPSGGVDQNVPALALAFAFGLSMDYEVFLLSRIKETRDALAGSSTAELREWLRHSHRRGRHAAGRHESANDVAVRYGLQHSGRIITSAALIVVIVFAGFVAGQLLIIKEIGVALAVAVAVDATLVRMLLVPATMTLLGEWNWWAPAPLRRFHDRFGITEH